MAGEKIQYAWFTYHDDSDTIWVVQMRKRSGLIGNFEPLTLEQQSQARHTASMWGWQQLAMRHISIRLDNGRYMQVPCQKPTSTNYQRIGERVNVPLWDYGIDDGAAPSDTIGGTIVNRQGESFKGKPYRPIPGDIRA